MSDQQWVDFQQIKSRIGIEDVLDKYGLTEQLKRRGEELVGNCPIHSESNYEKNSFAANTARNIWHCFACGASGNVLDFVMAMEGIDVRKAGLTLQEWFHLAPSDETKQRAKEKGKDESKEDSPPDQDEQKQVNPPLDFTLKSLDPKHAYLTERGLTEETVSEFGLGYCSRGLMKGRIAIPIHNRQGKLIAYAGRWPGDPPEGEPKYKLPAEFAKQAELFNFHRLQLSENAPKLILVEGFFDVFNLWQAGYTNVVATMGTVLSGKQAELLIDALGSNGRLALLFDGDDPGIKGAKTVRDQLIGEVYVKWIRLEADMQPDALTKERLDELLT